MQRCTLCGGKLRGGKCTECGLDNTKNDRMYRLNVHNEKDTVFVHEDCRDGLNRERRPGKKGAEKSERRDMAGGKKDTRRDMAGGKKDTRRDMAGGKKDTRRNMAGGKKDTHRNMTGGGVKNVGRDMVGRSPKDVGRKKKRGITRLVVWLIFLYALVQFLPALIFIFRENVAEHLPQEWILGSDLEEEASAVERPDEMIWNTGSEGYFETALTQGMYTVGYEIPAGTYQIFCDQGTAWINWWDETGEYSSFAALYSLDSQESYAESFGECDYFELTEQWDLKEGDVLYVESCEQPLRIVGEGRGQSSLKEREPQNLPAAVELRSGMTVGKEILPGIYDIVLEEAPEDGYASAYVTIDTTKNESWHVSLHENMPELYRFPLAEGDTIELTKYGNDASVRLVPSF